MRGNDRPLWVDGGPSCIARKSAAVGGGCVKTLKSQQGGELFSLLPFFRSQPPALFLSRLTKSRRTFYAQIECLCFHTASTRSCRSSPAFWASTLLDREPAPAY